MSQSPPASPPRLVPAVTVDDEPFWTAGLDGELRIQRCEGCGQFQLPPTPVCHHCLSRDLAWTAVPGTGTVYTFTINHQPWLPGLEVPYAVVVVELDEVPGVRLLSRLVDVDPETVRIGLRVRVVFDVVDGAGSDALALPLFTAEEA